MADVRAPDAGFSMIEALVAMTVLALGAVSLLIATESHTSRITEVIDRTTARWVAENRLAELRLGLAPGSGDPDMLGRRWRVTAQISATTDADLQAVTIGVGLADQPGDAVLARLDGYFSAPVTP